MANSPKLLHQFLIPDDNLIAEPTIDAARDDYAEKRHAFGEARIALNAATTTLYDLLDAPLRRQGAIPDGKTWTLREDTNGNGLQVLVWDEPRQRGRRKPEMPTRRFEFQKVAKG